MSDFKIYAICVIRNEEDIIKSNLEFAKQWFDKIIVFDTGSTDKTWEIVLSLADEKIIPFKTDNKIYSDSLRSEIFNHYKSEMNHGDWWAIQDADEFFLESPKGIISKYGKHCDVISSKKIDFVLTKEEADIDTNNVNQLENMLHYRNWAWSEMRLFKHRKGLEWESAEVWPSYLGVVGMYQIKVLHYPVRSVTQAQNKFREKKELSEKDPTMFRHIIGLKSWKDLLPSENQSDISRLSTSENIVSVFNNITTRNDLRDGTIKKMIKRTLQILRIWP